MNCCIYLPAHLDSIVPSNLSLTVWADVNNILAGWNTEWYEAATNPQSKTTNSLTHIGRRCTAKYMNYSEENLEPD